MANTPHNYIVHISKEPGGIPFEVINCPTIEALELVCRMARETGRTIAENIIAETHAPWEIFPVGELGK